MLKRLFTLLAFFCGLQPLLADNWPAWRGPDGQGHCGEENLPLKWSPSENVRWKIELPDEGNSTPIVWGERIFLTQAIGRAADSRRLVMCLDRADGKLLWQKETLYSEKEPTHATNPYCSASPVTDGEHVVASLGSAGLVCYDFAGHELWRRDIGKLEHIWGNASSPILYRDLAILAVGPGKRQSLLAVNKRTGEKVWEIEGDAFAAKIEGDGQKSWNGSWSTPLIVRVADHDELLLGVPSQLKGFDPLTGKELWHCDGLTPLVYTSPLYADGIAVQMSGFGGAALAVKLGGSNLSGSKVTGSGDITKDRLWRHPKNTQRIGSGVIVDGYIYILEEPGVPHCYELKTGNEIWKVEKRPGGSSWSSMVAAGGRLYVLTKNGDTHVFAASPKYELLATNHLGEDTNSSIAISNGELFIRTKRHLWCISEKKEK